MSASGASGPNQVTLNRVKLQASVDEGDLDSVKLGHAVTALTSAAEALKTIAVDVGWTGLSAESSAETFNALGSKLLEHSANVTALGKVASDAETLVVANRAKAADVAALFDTADVMQPMIDAMVPVREIRDGQALKELQILNAEAAALTVSAETVKAFAQENPVDPQALLPAPVSVPSDEDDGGSDWRSSPAGPSGGSGLVDGYSGTPYGAGGTVAGAVTGTGSIGSGWGSGSGTGSGYDSGTGAAGSGSSAGSAGGRGSYTSVDGATGGYVDGAGGYGSVDRGGASGFGGAGAGAGGSIGAGGSSSPGSAGTSAGAFGAGSAGLLGGARSGVLGGARSGLFGGSGGANGRAGGPALAGAGAGGSAGARGAGVPAAVPGTGGTAAASGTTGGMMGGGGAGGAGGGSKKGRRTSSTYLAPRIDEDPSAPGRVSAMGAGSRAALAATPPLPQADEHDDDRW